MTDRPPEEPSKDWMETWYETGDLPVPGPLSPEARAHVLNVFDELIAEQRAALEDDGDEP